MLIFGEGDGIVSHFKLIGTGSNLKILYVKDCTKIVEFDVLSKKVKWVGTTKDAVLAMQVRTTKLRAVDLH